MLMYKSFLSLPLTGESFNQRFLNEIPARCSSCCRGEPETVVPVPAEPVLVVVEALLFTAAEATCCVASVKVSVPSHPALFVSSCVTEMSESSILKYVIAGVTTVHNARLYFTAFIACSIRADQPT